MSVTLSFPMLRRYLLLLLIALLPLQGLAAARMMHCTPPAAVAPAGTPENTAAGSHAHAAESVAHDHGAAAAPESDSAAGTTQDAPAFKGRLAGCSDCGHCAVCYPALSPALPHAPPAADSVYLPAPVALAPDAEYQPLLRPPRAA